MTMLLLYSTSDHPHFISVEVHISLLTIPLLLIYSMVQSPSWEANWLAASQEIPRISRNPKVHYRTQKRPPPVSILGQPNPVHMLTSHLLQIHPNIIHSSTPRSPQWSLSLRFPHQDPIHSPLLTHTRHTPSPSHSSWFYHPHDIGWGSAFGYCINFCIYAMLRTRATFVAHPVEWEGKCCERESW